MVSSACGGFASRERVAPEPDVRSRKSGSSRNRLCGSAGEKHIVPQWIACRPRCRTYGGPQDCSGTLTRSGTQRLSANGGGSCAPCWRMRVWILATGDPPHVPATLRKPIISLLRATGTTNIARTLRYCAACPAEALTLVGLTEHIKVLQDPLTSRQARLYRVQRRTPHDSTSTVRQ